MTILSDKLMDASKGGAADSLRLTPTGVRGANGGGGIVGPSPLSPTVNPTTGAFTTVDLDPGPYTVRIKWRGKAEAETYKIVLPATGTNLELFPLIQAYVNVPESTPTERIAAAVASYVEANPDLGGGLSEAEVDARAKAVGDQNYVPFAALAKNPDALIAGTITRDANGAAISAPVVWPDGTVGTYTGIPSTTFPGAVDSYSITYGSPVTKTYTQPAVTRDANGAPTSVPSIVVS